MTQEYLQTDWKELQKWPQTDLRVPLKSPKGTIKVSNTIVTKYLQKFAEKAKIPAKMLPPKVTPGYFYNDPKVNSIGPQGTLRVTPRTLIVTSDYPDSTFKVIPEYFQNHP